MRSLGLISSNEKDIKVQILALIHPPDSSLCFLPSCSVGYLFQPMSSFGASCSPTAFSFDS
jgi:hypothetical protein